MAMTEIQKGRRLVVLLIVVYLAMELFAFLTTPLSQGMMQWVAQLIRGFLTLVLCAFLYSGHNWARWVVGILSTLGGLYGLSTGASLSSHGQPDILLIVLGLIELASAAILFFVPSVRAFFGPWDNASQSETDPEAEEAGG